MNPSRIFAKKTSSSSGELHLYGDIGSSWFSEGIESKKVVDMLKGLEDDGAKNLTVYINSPGGSVFEGLAIYNAIKRFDGPVDVVVDSLAASIASVIAMAAGKGRLKMNTGSMMMIHEPRGFYGGKASDMKNAATRLEKIRDEMVSIYTARTGRSEDDVKKLMAEETWMTSKDALKECFADALVEIDNADEEMRMVASATPLLATYKNLPDSLRAILARAYEIPAPRRDPEENKMDLTIIARALGLQPDASESSIIAAITEARASAAQAVDLREILALVGKNNSAEARGVILAWKASHEKVSELTAKLDKIEKDQIVTRVHALVDAAVMDGKIPPSMKEFWLTQNLATVESFVAAAPKLVPSDPVNPKPLDPTAVAVVAVAPDVQEQIFRALGIQKEEDKKEIRVRVQAQNAELARHGVKLPTGFIQ